MIKTYEICMRSVEQITVYVIVQPAGYRDKMRIQKSKHLKQLHNRNIIAKNEILWRTERLVAQRQ